jgi:hypothetical protein
VNILERADLNEETTIKIGDEFSTRMFAYNRVRKSAWCTLMLPLIRTPQNARAGQTPNMCYKVPPAWASRPLVRNRYEREMLPKLRASDWR